ncbi:MAG: glycerophosphodiester phosphodiesterase family protein [Bacilli bacterium]|jgi:glycerophosphoryl diester phosphodiesterase|nr:glycerophosphodiester phosphodiesterase family protein [Bacilli bacterium]
MNDLTNFLRIPLAHRGLYDNKYDENSLGAFKAAVERGYGIELDVHFTKDGTLAVVHDNDLTRVAKLSRRVSEMTKEELANTSLVHSKERIPTLDEVLEVVDGKVPLLIEIKVDGSFNERLPEAIMTLLDNYPDTNNIAIESFNPYAIRWLNKKYPKKYPYGQLISHELGGIGKFARWMFKTLNIRFISKPSFIAFDVNFLPNKKLRRLRKRGKAVISWTIDNEEKRVLALKETSNYIFEVIRP